MSDTKEVKVKRLMSQSEVFLTRSREQSAVVEKDSGDSTDEDESREATADTGGKRSRGVSRGAGRGVRRADNQNEDSDEADFEIKQAPKPRRLAKSEQIFQEKLNEWMDKAELHSDDYDTDLEDDFPPEVKPENDMAGIHEYLRQCELRGVTPVSFLIRNLGEGNLRMRHHCLGGSATVPLAKALAENTVTEEIDLSDNYIEGLGAKSLAAIMRDNMFIVNLNISNNFIRSQGAEAFGDMLENNNILKTLSLKGNQLTDNDAQRIGEALKNNLSLNTLDLSYNQIGEKGAEYLAEGLAINVALADLDLSWNAISRNGGAALAKALTKNQMLEIFDLSWNGLTDAGAAALGSALKTNKSLRVLDITNNRIGSEGAKNFSTGLVKNNGLETLLMAMNPIDPSGLEALLKAISVNKSLKLVDLQDIKTTPAIDARIAELCSSRDIMITTSIGTPQSNRMSATILTVFERFIQENANRLEDLFLQMDKDKSGDITLEEFKFGLKDFGIRLTSKQLDALLDELDADRSGTIELEELLAGTEIIEQENMKKAVREREKKLLQESIEAAAVNAAAEDTSSEDS